MDSNMPSSTRCLRAAFRHSNAFVLLATLAGVALADGGRGSLTAGPKAGGTSVTPQGWQVTPAGQQIPVGPAPLAVTTTPDGALVLVEDAGYDHHALLVFDAKIGAKRQEFAGASDGSSGYYLGLAV